MSETEAAPAKTITILSQRAIQDAVLNMVNAEKFSNRHLYVGGSEVGGCLREVAWKKSLPERARITDPESAGRILSGNLLENPIVQLVRSAIDGVVRETGRAQAEFIHETAPLRVHPDGSIQLKVEWVPGMRIVYLDQDAETQYLDALPEGKGTLEIKTCSSGVYRKYTKPGVGLNARYRGQTQVEMGLGKTNWTLLVLVNRENISQAATFLIFANEATYDTMVGRSHVIMEAVQRIAEEVELLGVDRAEAEEKHLPAAEPERGACNYCDHRDDCPAFAFRDIDKDSVATFPEDVAVEVEVWAEEYIETKPVADANEKLKTKIKDAFVEHGVREAFGLYIQTSEGRTTVDTKRLESEYPAIYEALKKKGDPSHSLKIARAKKAGK